MQALNILARERLREAGELGEEVTILTARGSRDFAAGDRIMFLRNERGLGVKNGSLGRVESAGATRMAVRLDDGRSVAFDIKDYAHVDHGYAATVHKAQGVTVDGVHVLATPGLDRHAAYVALSRHREQVDLHYGRDDFADHGKLVRTLSRERSKDMASDYAREFGERRAILLPPAPFERSKPAPACDPFEGLGLRAVRTPAPARDMFDGLKLPPARPAPRPERLQLGQAVQRFARAAADVVRMREAGREALPHQMETLRNAGRALDSVRPHGWRDLAKAFNRHISLIAMAANGRTGTAIRAMMLEGELRTNPERRAERFIGEWRKLADQREMHRFNVDEAGVRRAKPE